MVIVDKRIDEGMLKMIIKLCNFFDLRNRIDGIGVQRKEWIDELKGTLIYLVILGHCIQYVYCDGMDYFQNPVFKFIYSFHMPAFSVISGYLFYLYTIKYELINAVKRRIHQLFVPCIMWGTINYFLGHNKLDILFYIEYLLEKNWFLWAMLYCSFIMLISEKLKNRYRISFFPYIIIFITLFIPDIANLIDLEMMLPFFLLGYTLREKNYVQKIISASYLNKILWVIGGVVIYLILMKFMISYQDIMIWEYYCIGNTSIISSLLKKYLIGAVASFVLILFFAGFQKKQVKIKKMIMFLGRYTLGIYMVQSFLFKAYTEYFMVSIEWSFTEKWVYTIMISVIITIGCFGIIMLLNKFNVTRALLLGIVSK